MGAGLSTGNTPPLESGRQRKTEENKGEKAAYNLERLQVCGIVAAAWETSGLPFLEMQAPSSAPVRLELGDRLGHFRTPWAVEVLGFLLFFKHLFSGWL